MNLEEYKSYFCELTSLLAEEPIDALVEMLDKHCKSVFIIGNGGSASLASHFAQDLTKQGGINAISLTDSVALITAYANDEGYINAFVGQLKTRAVRGDMLIAISGSGNSPNILKAVEWANDFGVFTVGISGYSNNKLHKLVRHSICAWVDDMETVESIFSFICHYVVIALK